MMADIKDYEITSDYVWIEYESTGRVAYKQRGEVFWSHFKNKEEFVNRNSIKSVHIDFARLPKGRAIDKVKVYGETYSLKQNEDNLIVYCNKDFNLKQGKAMGVVQSFNKVKMKDVDYLKLEQDYTKELVRFNGGYSHDIYLTSTICEMVFRNR